jgi:cytochrome c553
VWWETADRWDYRRDASRRQRAACETTGFPVYNPVRITTYHNISTRVLMKRKCTLLFAVLASALAAGASAAEGGDAQAGQRKASMCQGCHGIEGYRMAFPEVYSVPRLGGQHAAYIVKSLQAYKAGNRNNATMRAIASNLSEQDMADLAAYYAAASTATASAK